MTVSITPALLATMKHECREEGLTRREIAEKHGLGIRVVERRLAGVKRGKHQVRRRKPIPDGLIEDYKRGASIKKLAEKTGRSYGYVQSVLAESPEVEVRPGPRKSARQ